MELVDFSCEQRPGDGAMATAAAMQTAAEAYDRFTSCLAQALKWQVNLLAGTSQVFEEKHQVLEPLELEDVASTPSGLPCGWVTWALWSMALLVVVLLVIGVLLWKRLWTTRSSVRRCRKQSEKDTEDVCTTSVEAVPVLPGAQEDVEKAASVEGLQRYIEELQVKHQEELRQRDAKMEEVKQELREKTAEGLELWEDAKRQRKEANRLQSFAISATNSLRKVQREVNRLQRVIAQQKAKYVELQESQRARREVLMLKELDLARREAEVSSLAQAEQDELAELREWLAAPEGAKDEHRRIAGLRAEVKEWQETYKKEKASWMRAICELTKQRDLQVSRADLFAKQLGQWRDIFQETDLTNLEQEWDPESSFYANEDAERRESCQSSPEVFHMSSPRSDSEARSSTD